MRRRLFLAYLFAGAACSAETVEVGVFSLFRPQRLVVKPAAAQVLRVEIDGRVEYLEGAQEASFLRAARVTARNGGPAEFTLAVPGRIERRFRGTLRIASRAGALEAVVAMDLETAVASVVAAESPPAAPLEALKAQAVAARSYFLAARGRHNGFDFCDTTHCQFLRAPAEDERAARETAGLVLVHESAVVGALYSASCGGRTKSLAEVGLPERGYPFFPVDCEACRSRARQWTARFTGPDAERLLASPHSETARLAIVRRLGWSALAGNNYEIGRDGEAVVLRGRGAGHGVGLCQQGAASMASAGADFRAILNHYFPATLPLPN